MRILRSVSVAASTFFYLGYLPLIPGTFGSAAGVFVFYACPAYMRVWAVLALVAVGFLFAGRAAQALGAKDPACIVIDEVCGMLIGLAFVPGEPRLVIIGFLLFRILDTLKPYPASVLQHLKGSAGIMLDDVVAGVYTNVLLQLVLRYASWSGS